MIQLKVNDIMSFGFTQAIQKLTSTPVHGVLASQIYTMTRQLEKARAQILKQHAALKDSFAKRDENGKIIEAENPLGFEIEEGKEETFKEAQNALKETLIPLNCQSFTAQQLNDIKLTAGDIANLKGLFAGYIPLAEDEGQEEL